MRRPLYLTTLLMLQVALVVKFTAPLAQALRIDAVPGMAPGGWPAVLQLVAAAAAVAGTSLALVFPAVALTRHRRAGVSRFFGLPQWAVTLALIGAMALGAGTIVLALVATLPVDAQMTAVLIARPVVAGGLALTAAGVLTAELLRRSVAESRTAIAGRRPKPGRIAVTDPPELRTYVA